MAIKRLTFPDTAEGREMFRKLCDGILLGSHALRQKEPTNDKDASKNRTRLEARIQKKFYLVSDHIPEDKRPMCVTCGQPAGRVLGARDLKAGVQHLDYESAELEHIDKLLQCVGWGGADQIAVSDLYDLLADAKTVAEATKR